MSRGDPDRDACIDPNIAFSLIISTIGETRHFERLLKSLVAQRFRNFEVIIVDQSPDARVQDLIEAYRDRLTILHTSSARGVSRGRNRGIALARGRFVAFPDDDCWYAEDLLQHVHTMLTETRVDGVFGRCLDALGRSAAGRHARTRKIVNKNNVWSCGVSATIFFRKTVLDDVGPFDTTIGLGSGTPFLSGEETDVILRALSRRCTFQYDPSVVIFHDSVSEETFTRDLAKAWSYGLGMGLILRRHRYGMPFVLYSVTRPVVGAALSLCMGRYRLAGVRLVRAAARFEGWRRGG
ncbi:glycosyltransferase family 2 protein [Methylobacterium sp. CM6257]|jgi:glycosyltransferase involved in cell wall biosynthesis